MSFRQSNNEMDERKQWELMKYDSIYRNDMLKRHQSNQNFIAPKSSDNEAGNGNEFVMPEFRSLNLIESHFNAPTRLVTSSHRLIGTHESTNATENQVLNSPWIKPSSHGNNKIENETKKNKIKKGSHTIIDPSRSLFSKLNRRTSMSSLSLVTVDSKKKKLSRDHDAISSTEFSLTKSKHENQYSIPKGMMWNGISTSNDNINIIPNKNNILPVNIPKPILNKTTDKINENPIDSTYGWTNPKFAHRSPFQPQSAYFVEVNVSNETPAPTTIERVFNNLYMLFRSKSLQVNFTNAPIATATCTVGTCSGCNGECLQFKITIWEKNRFTFMVDIDWVSGDSVPFHCYYAPLIVRAIEDASSCQPSMEYSAESELQINHKDLYYFSNVDSFYCRTVDYDNDVNVANNNLNESRDDVEAVVKALLHEAANSERQSKYDWEEHVTQNEECDSLYEILNVITPLITSSSSRYQAKLQALHVLEKLTNPNVFGRTTAMRTSQIIFSGKANEVVEGFKIEENDHGTQEHCCQDQQHFNRKREWIAMRYALLNMACLTSKFHDKTTSTSPYYDFTWCSTKSKDQNKLVGECIYEDESSNHEECFILTDISLSIVAQSFVLLLFSNRHIANIDNTCLSFEVIEECMMPAVFDTLFHYLNYFSLAPNRAESAATILTALLLLNEKQQQKQTCETNKTLPHQLADSTLSSCFDEHTEHDNSLKESPYELITERRRQILQNAHTFGMYHHSGLRDSIKQLSKIIE